MRRLKDQHLVPPTDFVYTHETGHTTRARTYSDWVRNAKDHQRANGLPVPLDFEAQLNEQLCSILPPEWCDRDAGDVSAWIDTKFSWADFADGMQIFTKWGDQGMPLVDETEANRRAAICVSCPLNVNITGCAACHKMASLITGAVAHKKGSHDDYLKACSICHCSNKAQVWFPMDLLETTDTPEKQNFYPHFCWKQRLGYNYKSSDKSSVSP